MKRVAQVTAVALACAAGAAALLAPAISVETADSMGGASTETVSILTAMGPWAIGLALLPVAITVAPLLVPPRARQRTTVLATVLLAGWIIAGVWSIGGYAAPSFLCLLASLVLPPRASPRRGGGERLPAPR